ncbi:MAG: EamA family transporter [Coriobacteriaceae bacterium]|nr:EamA family transporter [Coriobacteriaceae bacterium]
MWILAAVGSALFAGLTSVLAKLGIRTTDSDVATAIRTTVVLAFAWIMALITGEADGLSSISPRSLLFLALSGAATGASWLCYFKALAIGDVNKVVPIDKSSTALTVLLAIALLGETEHLVVRIAGSIAIGIGTLAMIERREPEGASGSASPSGSWLVYAIMSAVFASLTSILAKVGIEQVDSNLATALRTVVVLLMAWGIVIGKGKGSQVMAVGRKELAFICASGVATGASWLCLYHAIQAGTVSVVIPIDKLSILVSIGFSAVVLGERLSRRAAIGLALIVAGTLAMAIVR